MLENILDKDKEYLVNFVMFNTQVYIYVWLYGQEVKLLKIDDFSSAQQKLAMEEIQKLHNQQLIECNQTADTEVDGFMMTEKFLENYETVRNFEVHNSDIWVCSFPKTGTTWLQEMVWLIGNNLDFEGAAVTIDERFPFLEYTAMFNPFPAPGTIYESNIDTLQYTAEQKDPRFIKTHLPWCLLPKQIQDGSIKPKILYITRNPKDVCDSYYIHHKIFGMISYEFEKFCEMFLADKLEYEPFWGHILPFWYRRQDENMLFLKYEDLKQDLPQAIREVANFLKTELDDQQVEKLREHLSFENMKSNCAVNYGSQINALRQLGISKCSADFIRSGTSGSYNKHMSPQMIRRFDKWIKKNTENTDFHFYDAT